MRQLDLCARKQTLEVSNAGHSNLGMSHFEGSRLSR